MNAKGTFPRQAEFPSIGKEFREEVFRAVRLGLAGQIPLKDAVRLAGLAGEDRQKGLALPTVTVQLRRAIDELLEVSRQEEVRAAAERQPPPSLETTGAPAVPDAAQPALPI